MVLYRYRSHLGTIGEYNYVTCKAVFLKMPDNSNLQITFFTFTCGIVQPHIYSHLSTLPACLHASTAGTKWTSQASLSAAVISQYFRYCQYFMFFDCQIFKVTCQQSRSSSMEVLYKMIFYGMKTKSTEMFQILRLIILDTTNPPSYKRDRKSHVFPHLARRKLQAFQARCRKALVI